ncbi:GARP complex component (Vps54), putative [Penicillium digitatum]|uniref:GARP complex component (Vps54), putative n=3 Tax=Penicillium digitatum TaxID=36651 RepID=K9FNT3_PEND2|nr:GARP complex component (Vps54), putative [Penicillium digitatum Pd1]EKV10854.1 GARP complex component (Vps54), putative [Penicillium digitatum PHI26]EKV13371.1 GARP complex component (Vps54), putative [Penicillium digitatum Pd1]QQK43568.1 GARP complex component (Vps54), putative [Penicillium digitatum]
MSTTSPRKSIDSLASGVSSPSVSFSTSQLESPRLAPQRFPLRKGSVASSIVSIGGVLESSYYHGSISESVAESGQNAISTLLQPPIIRTGMTTGSATSSASFKPPSSRDIPPVTLTNIKHVDAKAFQPYLSQVGSLYDVFQQSKEDTGEDALPAQAAKSPKPDFDPDSLMPWSSERRPSVMSIASRPSSPYDTRGRRPSSARGRAPAVTPLSTIPPVYFEEGFHLENPRTFDVISEKSDVVRPPRPPTINGLVAEPVQTGRKALATNAILQEKLSWYMDTVEIHLISSISTASKSFFTALGSLRELHAEAADSVNRIQILRKDLQKIDKEMALGGLKIVNLRRRRENVRMLAAAVAQLREVVESVSRCEGLVERGDIEEAADGLEEVEKLMAGERFPDRAGSENEEGGPRRLIDLRGIKALEGAPDDLAQLRQRIGMGYETRFLNDLLGDLRQHVQTVPSNVTLLRWGNSFKRQRGSQRSGVSVSPAYLNFDNELRSQLNAQLNGLARAHYTMPAATSFKTAVLREMKGLIRKHLPSSSDDDNESMVSLSTHVGPQLSQQEKSSILARNLRALDADDAYSMLVNIYTGISESLRRLSVQVKVLLDIASGLGNSPTSGFKSPPRSPNLQSMDQAIKSSQIGPTASDMAQDEILQVLDMSSLLGQAVDIAQSQITKVLKVRSEQTAQLSKEEFLRYFTLNRLFADECEAISGRSGTALKTIVGNQIRDFIARFGDSQRHKIVNVMDADRWDARDFGDAENTILTRILDASTKDIDAWIEVPKIWIPFPRSEQEKPADNAAENGTDKSKVRSAVIDEQKYILPDSAVAIMRSIEEFDFLMSNIPTMIQDIAPHLLDILKLFNSRSSQLILGAGATRSAGLKNITTKHLALSSQALSFVIALVPYVREFVRRHGPTNPLMAEFDKVKRLCQEHQSGIHEKLVDIMGSRSSVHVNAMKKIDWNFKGATPAVNPYMETLAKETGTLHRVLSKHLPDMTVSMIMMPVFNSYRDQWTKAFQEADVQTEAGTKRMQADVEHFRAKLSKIEGASEVGDKLLEVVRAKINTITNESVKSQTSERQKDQDDGSDSTKS